MYQTAQEKRKQIVKIDEEIIVCDSQIERLSETIKVAYRKYHFSKCTFSAD